MIVLAGPTAVGKSSVALELCRRTEEEDGRTARILSADSVQAYAGPSIGANKPSARERERFRHDLLDLYDAAAEEEKDKVRTAADWYDVAVACLEECVTEKSVPVVAGGTMMYVNWLIYGRPDVGLPSDAAVKRAEEIMGKNREEEEGEGWEKAVQAAAAYGTVFRERAENIEQGDWYRLQRTMETALTDAERRKDDKGAGETTPEIYTGKKRGGLDELGYDARCFFLCPDDRRTHASVVDERCEQMIMRGLIQETADLRTTDRLPDKGVVAKAIGYRQTLDYLLRPDPRPRDANVLSLFVDRHMAATRRYSQQQLKWYRKDGGFLFVPVPVAAAVGGKERIASVADMVQRWAEASREEYEGELRNRVAPADVAAVVGGGGAGGGTRKRQKRAAAEEKVVALLEKMNMSQRTRTVNELQGSDMKTFASKRTVLSVGSDAFETVLEVADRCTAQLQELGEDWGH